VGFVVDKMALGAGVLRVLRFPLPNLHSTNYSTITLIYHLGLCNRPDVAAVPGDVSPTPLIIIIIIIIKKLSQEILS
jgi:hypothetical protein